MGPSRLWHTLDERDFVGNDDITLAELTAAVASIEAIVGFVNQGHATNLYQIVPEPGAHTGQSGHTTVGLGSFRRTCE